MRPCLVGQCPGSESPLRFRPTYRPSLVLQLAGLPCSRLPSVPWRYWYDRWTGLGMSVSLSYSGACLWFVVAAPLRLAGHLGVVSPACSEDMPVEYPWFVD